MRPQVEEDKEILTLQFYEELCIIILDCILKSIKYLLIQNQNCIA